MDRLGYTEIFMGQNWAEETIRFKKFLPREDPEDARRQFTMIESRVPPQLARGEDGGPAEF